jgi:hypothetical protein
MRKLVLAAALGLPVAFSPATATVADADSLYVGDGNDNTIKSFDASTGKYLGVFVNHNSCPPNPSSSPRVGCLYGPRGLILDGSGHLLVADQNVNLGIRGAIYEYSAQTGAFVKPLVPYTDPNAPPAPRGVVLYPNMMGNVLFVASPEGIVTGSDPCVSGAPSGTGCVQAFNASDGTFLRFLPPPDDLASSFHPRGVVIGPDGLLYVSNAPNLAGLDGQVLVYHPGTGMFPVIFVSNDTCNCDLNRPEGLVFGPDGNLYVASFRANPNDTDKILVFAGPAKSNPGAFIGQIVLDQVGDFRAYAQALLFGPDDKLFVPITTPTGKYSGQVRVYDVKDVSSNTTLTPFKLFVPSSSKQNSPLGSSWYLTFGDTDPVTLNYVGTP